MIIRILGEGQFRMDDKHIGDLNKIDNRIVNHVKEGDQIAFREDLDKLISTVKDLSEPLDPVDIIQSDLIFPPEDLSFEEAKRVFSGDGIIKD
ncbi:Uncharacterised protein [uncultured archaeon]|nr:Uncharacterised protein [uncultured archaeon]